MRHGRGDVVHGGVLVGLWGVNEVQAVTETGGPPAGSAGSRRGLRTPATRPGLGSFRLLEWLGRPGVAGVEPLALALGMSVRRVQSHVARLGRDGLLARAAGGDGEGSVALLTRAGARACAERGAVGVASTRSAAPTSARHGQAVSWVAGSAEVRGWRWLGAAELRVEDGWWVRVDAAGWTREIRCLFSGHPDCHPSAGLYRSASHARLYKCCGCRANLSLADLFAAVTSGEEEFRGLNGPTARLWLVRRWPRPTPRNRPGVGYLYRGTG